MYMQNSHITNSLSILQLFFLQLSIQRMDTLDMYMFRSNQWFSKKIDDKKIVREIPAETSKEGAVTIKSK